VRSAQQKKVRLVQMPKITNKNQKRNQVQMIPPKALMRMVSAVFMILILLMTGMMMVMIMRRLVTIKMMSMRT
jgi:hypothetical protein